MLLIDDEADNASINTNKEDLDPTRTNAMIRRILGLFAKSCYVGYTATPFANIFINPDAYDDDVREELFPRDFIYRLDAPTTYFGAEKVFLDDKTSQSIVKPIDDCEDFLPTGTSATTRAGAATQPLPRAGRVHRRARHPQPARADRQALLDDDQCVAFRAGAAGRARLPQPSREGDA
jgi:hypothetical protein